MKKFSELSDDTKAIVASNLVIATILEDQGRPPQLKNRRESEDYVMNLLGAWLRKDLDDKL